MEFETYFELERLKREIEKYKDIELLKKATISLLSLHYNQKAFLMNTLKERIK